MSRFKICFTIAKVFFLVGSCILLLHLLFKEVGIFVWIGYIYTLFSIVINSIIVIVLCIGLILEKPKIETLKSIGVILINAPIAYGYFLIVLHQI